MVLEEKEGIALLIFKGSDDFFPSFRSSPECQLVERILENMNCLLHILFYTEGVGGLFRRVSECQAAPGRWGWPFWTRVNSLASLRSRRQAVFQLGASPDLNAFVQQQATWVRQPRESGIRCGGAFRGSLARFESVHVKYRHLISKQAARGPAGLRWAEGSISLRPC